MPEFLTVTQAAQQTGRSASSIRRRIIYPILENDQHPDRSHVEPSVEEVRRLRMKGENFAWRVSRELLDRHGPPKESAELPKEKIFAGVGDEPTLREVVNLLRDQVLQNQQQLKVKDDQIATLSEITKSLNDRMREGNILMGQLQRQLSLTSGGPQAPTDVVDTTNAKPDASAASALKSKTVPKKTPKKGLFAR